MGEKAWTHGKVPGDRYPSITRVGGVRTRTLPAANRCLGCLEFQVFISWMKVAEVGTADPLLGCLDRMSLEYSRDVLYAGGESALILP